MEATNTTIGRICLDASTVEALIAGKASAEQLRQAAEHLIDTPQAGGCASCKEQLGTRFLAEADPDDPEVSATRAYLEGQLEQAPGPLIEILGREAAGAETLAKWERWAESREGTCNPDEIPGVILASYALRFDYGAPGLLSYARLAVTMADRTGDAWGQAFAHAWLSRVRGIRGELREASREVDAAMKAADRLDGVEHKTARAFALHQSADLRLRLRDFGPARDRLDRAIELYKRLNPSREDHALNAMGILLTESAQWEEARVVYREIFRTNRKALVLGSALLSYTAEVLPNLAREGQPGMAERALCMYSSISQVMQGEALGLRARESWRRGRIAWALGANEAAKTNLEHARTLFLAAAPDTAGMYEAATITLDMLGSFLQAGSLRELQAYALEAANIFSALGADISSLVALGLVRQLETRAGGAGIHALAHARIALELAEKRRLLRAVGEGGVI